MAGPACSICVRPDAEAVTAALHNPRNSLPMVHRLFPDASLDALKRHRHARHMVPPPASDAEEDAEREARQDGDTPRVHILKLRGLSSSECVRAIRRGDYRSAAAFARESRLANEQLGQLQGDLGSGTSVNVGVAIGGQDNLDLAIRLLRALEPWPAARTAVMAELTAGGIDGLTVEGEPLAIEGGGV